MWMCAHSFLQNYKQNPCSESRGLKTNTTMERLPIKLNSHQTMRLSFLHFYFQMCKVSDINDFQENRHLAIVPISNIVYHYKNISKAVTITTISVHNLSSFELQECISPSGAHFLMMQT
jgi:hypothetical protein